MGYGHFNVPALNQQEGTFTSIDLKVVNTNAAITFDGYCLNDLANEIKKSSLLKTTKKSAPSSKALSKIWEATKYVNFGFIKKLFIAKSKFSKFIKFASNFSKNVSNLLSLLQRAILKFLKLCTKQENMK